MTEGQPLDLLVHWADEAPDRIAITMLDSGITRTYRELLDRSGRLARHFQDLGLRRGDVVAILMENRVEYLEIAWAAQRAGLYYTAVNWHLHPDEVAYILADCGARVLVTSELMSGTLERLPSPAGAIEQVISAGRALPGTTPYEQCLLAAAAAPVTYAAEGCELLYSSGTTGRPKAIKRPLPPPGQLVPNHQGAMQLYHDVYGASADAVYLSPAPLYHSAPLMSCLTIHRLGGNVVVMERFDAERALAGIERRAVTLGQFVPTMFVRMLKLPTAVRERYDLTSLRCVIHASAPCPAWVKRDMIAWWGPILHEYYGGTEGMGTTRITSAEWLEHPGSVGRAVGFRIHIVGEDGAELAPGATGLVYFESSRAFEYLNDPVKTASISDERGWRTLGDVGHLDEDGYLYLTDRASFMIISGGVNIYPQEIENVLIAHPAVADAAVFGIPNDDLGEEVKAVIEPAAGVLGSPELGQELIAWCGEHLGRFKVPRSLEFTARLPRDPNGKLYKKELRAPFWPDRPPGA